MTFKPPGRFRWEPSMCVMRYCAEEKQLTQCGIGQWNLGRRSSWGSKTRSEAVEDPASPVVCATARVPSERTGASCGREDEGVGPDSFCRRARGGRYSWGAPRQTPPTGITDGKGRLEPGGFAAADRSADPAQAMEKTKQISKREKGNGAT